jgi:type IV pilus assembly protein PilQ
VPFLKDLPWWVFGLRYIFGYDQVTTTTQEVIMLIKVNILPTLKERIEVKKDEAALKTEWEKNNKEMQNYSNQADKARAEKKQESEPDTK